MKIKSIFLAFVCAAILSSCAVTVPCKVTNNPIGTKKGVSKTVTLASGLGIYAKQPQPMIANTVYQGLVFNKNFGIMEAVKNGKINKIGCVDLKITNYIFFTKLEYIVSGE